MAVDKNKRRMPWRRERETTKWQTRIANKNPSNVTRVCTTAAVATLFPPLLSLFHSHQSGKKSRWRHHLTCVLVIKTEREKERSHPKREKTKLQLPPKLATWAYKVQFHVYMNIFFFKCFGLFIWFKNSGALKTKVTRSKKPKDEKGNRRAERAITSTSRQERFVLLLCWLQPSFFSVTSFDAKRNIITTRRFFLGKDSLTE